MIRGQKERIFMQELRTGTGVLVKVQRHGICRENEHDLSDPVLQEVCKAIMQDVPHGKGLESVLFFTKKFDHVVGLNKYVEIQPQDEVIYAKPIGEKAEIPWINKAQEPTDMATVVMMRINEKEYLMLSHYYGPYHYNYPWKYTDEVEKQKAIAFWKQYGVATNLFKD